MMKVMSQQSAQIAMSNKQGGTFLRQDKVDTREMFSSFFLANNIRKFNVVIFLRAGNKVGTYMDEHNVNGSPPYLVLITLFEGCISQYVFTSPSLHPLFKVVEDPKEHKSSVIINSTRSKLTPSSSPMAKSIPPFPN